MDTRKDSAASVGVTTTPESPRPARSSESLGSAVHQIFENQVARTPDAVALIWENDQMTYRELNARANRLAHYLRACGVTREGLTGVCLRRSPETVIAFLAILKAGGAYVPLDPDYPPERLAFMLEDTRAPVIVTDRNCANALPHHGATVVMIDESAEAIRTQDPTNPALGTTTRDLVYVMYTSGSTGRPKGVMIEHRAVARLVRGADYAAFDATQRFLLLAPISFDASTFEIWGPLLNGGSLAIAPPETPSLEQIGNLIQRLGVTTLWLTAGLFNLMIDQHPKGLRP
ncbi:MAG TPA: AMP-binding protein, partial [Candidatus Binataceae bacterium]|nr:AMP-binding protein [Candidatus Binataceae bacterium]